jgi:hypothetical protein
MRYSKRFFYGILCGILGKTLPPKENQRGLEESKYGF